MRRFFIKKFVQVCYAVIQLVMMIMKTLKCTCFKHVKNLFMVVAMKIFAREIFERIQRLVKEILRKQQAGFRRRKSCRDQIFVMRRLIEEA